MSKNNEQSSKGNNFSLVPVPNSQNNNSSPGSIRDQPSNNCNGIPNLSVQDLPPQTLQDLLKISTRLQSNSSSAPQEQLTSERADFLRNALGAMTVDLVSEIQKKLEVLKEIQSKPESYVDANLHKYEGTLEQLIEFLFEIDHAKMFYQIDGLNVITPLLKSKHTTLRSAAATIILECCKNNPFCQELSMTDDVFGSLMEMAFSDRNEEAMFKAIAAISAIIRTNPAGIGQFTKYNGIQMVQKALNSGCDRIVNKTIFLVIGLCDTDETLKTNLTDSDVCITLITLLHNCNYLVKEYVLRALLSLTKDNATAEQICRQHDLQTYLGTLCSNTDPEHQDLVECATNLQNQLGT